MAKPFISALTIPFIIAFILFLVFGILSLRDNKTKSGGIMSIVCAVVSCIATVIILVVAFTSISDGL